MSDFRPDGSRTAAEMNEAAAEEERHICLCFRAGERSDASDNYTLEIDAGGVILTHADCGKRSAPWADDDLMMEPIPVRVQRVTEEHYSGEVDAYDVITLREVSDE